MSKASTVKTEAEDSPSTVDVPFKGVVFTVPTNPLDWGMETMEALDGNKISLALAGMLGPRQYANLKKLNPSLQDAVDLLSAISAASGTGSTGN
ncbi:hypothetical protein SAMN05421505_112121 [Sinosporangium album]|uniref:Uncharacterized protein n=1 Tax=Sinosporangium album TaxID=504805 RepID=A0A1G8AEM5_9ACTN|nr:hypothetical protein [Sinosporangium album]SDH19296.1 hypothetical protein SAMN05421505_112121 [Sinosporangium album]